MTALSRFLPALQAHRAAALSVRRRGLALALLAGLGSCIVPQNVDPINTRVHPPPRIVIESIPTQQFVPNLVLAHAPDDVGCRCEISVPAVAEDDPTVLLQARWFIDYDVRVPASLKQTKTIDLNGSFDFTHTVRAGPTLAVDAERLGGDGYHTVEVMVAETSGYLADDDPQAQLPFRTLTPDYSAATYRFFVRVVSDTNAPRCAVQPASPPLCSGGTR